MQTVACKLNTNLFAHPYCVLRRIGPSTVTAAKLKQGTVQPYEADSAPYDFMKKILVCTKPSLSAA